MNDDTKTDLIWSVAITVCVCIAVTQLGSCLKSDTLAGEATKQEAIKAGLVQGEYGRWVKPAPEAK